MTRIRVDSTGGGGGTGSIGIEVDSTLYRVIADGVGYVIGDTIEELKVINTTTSAVTVTYSNKGTNTIVTPNFAHLALIDISTSDLQVVGNNSLSTIATNTSSANTTLVSILTQLQNDIEFSETIWYDVTAPTNFYVRTATLTEGTGVKVISFKNIDGTAATPVIANLVQVNSNTDFEISTVERKATIAGTGYSINDRIQEVQVFNLSLGTLVNTIWVNKTTNLVLSVAPVISDLTIDDTYADKANQILHNAKLDAIVTNTANIPVQGQALAASSLPVVLTASQLSTLTPLTGVNLEATQLLVKSKTDNLDVALSTLLKPADTLTAVTTVSAVTAITNALPTGTNTIGNTNQTLATAEFAKITDGTSTVSIKPSATTNTIADGSFVVQTSKNSPELQTVEAGVSASNSVLIGGVYNESVPVVTDGEGIALQVNPEGKLQTVANTGSTIYEQSVGNNTSTQLTAGTTFTGVIESALSYPQIIISIRSDQAITVNIDQYSDLAGTIQFPTITYTRIANEGFNQPITLSGSYYRLRITNTSAVTTTNLFAETWFGSITATPNLTNAGSIPVDIKTQSDYIVGATAQTAVINNILTPVSSSVALDSAGYHSGTTTVVSTATGGTYIFEGSNDNITFEVLTTKRTTLTTGIIVNSAVTATASTITYEYAVKYKYIRLRIATTITGGSIRTYSRLSSNVFTTDITRVSNSVAGDMQVTATQTGTWNIGTITSNQNAVNTVIIDVASGAITTSTTTATITPTWGTSYQVSIPVTAVGGTSPIMSVQIQESNDSGTNWYTVYTFPNIIATGIYVAPKLNSKGNRVRYIQTITGTTPSFTRAINRMQSNEIVQIQGSIPVITNSSIITGGSSQTALIAKPNRNYLEIQNNSTGDLWFNFNTNAGVNTGFKVGTLQSWSPIGGTCPESSITIFGATTGQTYAIAEF